MSFTIATSCALLTPTPNLEHKLRCYRRDGLCAFVRHVLPLQCDGDCVASATLPMHRRRAHPVKYSNVLLLMLMRPLKRSRTNR